MKVNHESKTSSIAKVIQKAVNEVVEPDYVSPCRTKDLSCNLAKGIEGLFVANIASQLHLSIQEAKPEWTFHQFVYMPSTSIERKCGFDLSFGHFENASGRRVRLMHKLKTEWCDEDWDWNSDLEVTPNGIYRCADHIFKLVSQFRDSDHKSHPFLSFSICHCLHEFRRMGSKSIPAFEDSRRSIFIDLRKLAEVLPDKFDNKERSGRLEVMHKVEQEKSSISARWILKGKTQTSLDVLDWSEFKKSAGAFLTTGG